MSEEVKRTTIYKYIKSGKLSAIYFNRKVNKYSIVDMSPDLRCIERVRSAQYLKRDSIASTGYLLEAIETIEKIDSDNYEFTYKFLRVLTQDDLNKEKWRSTKSLTDLPVGTHSQITEEEKIWAGERGKYRYRSRPRHLARSFIVVALWGKLFLDNNFSYFSRISSGLPSCAV